MPLQMPSTQSQYWAFGGGLDQVSPPLTMKPGYCRSALNFEVGKDGGYTRVKGYERFDGRPKPSDAIYYILPATMSGAWAVGNTLTGATSGATGVIVAGVEDEYFVITKVVGTFQAEVLNIAASPIATSSAGASASAASTLALNATYQNLAADEYRDDIAAVPGSGEVLGVWKYNNVVYAFRDNAGATASVMHKQTVSGWAAVSLGRELAFTSGGTTEIVAGNTITGATSAATAVVGAVLLTSGTWGAGTAAGYIYLTSQTGTFVAEDLNVGVSLNLASIAGDSTAIALSPGGRYEFVTHNFGGSAATSKMFGCDGVNRAFQFDGTNYIPIRTGMTADTPSHIAAHKNHLFLSFLASVQHSAVGNPLSFSVVLGAAEIAMGETVSGFQQPPGGTTSGALAIFTRNQTKILYGNSSSDWQLQTYNPNAGALPWTSQWIGMGAMLDDRGVTTMETSQAFGNFKDASISSLVDPFIQQNRSLAIASCIVREKGQYRLFFSNGNALFFTFVKGKVAGVLPVAFDNDVACVCSLEAASGEEEIFFGSSDGFVYQMERGTSFDGDSIVWSLELAFHHMGSPRQLKQWRKAVIEVSGTSYTEFQVGYLIGYGSTEVPQSPATSVTSMLSGTAWDSFVWDSFFWDGTNLSPSEVDLDGTAENISLAFTGDSDEFDSFTLNGSICSFTPRRAMR
jgi:hypothetical protein